MKPITERQMSDIRKLAKAANTKVYNVEKMSSSEASQGAQIIVGGDMTI